MLDAVCRVVRIDRQHRAARLDDGPERDHRVHRSADRQRNGHPGTHTSVDEQLGVHTRPEVEFTVGQRFGAAHQRHTVGVALHRAVEDLDHGARRGIRRAGDRRQLGPLRRRQQIDVTDPYVRVGDDGGRDRGEALGQRGDGRLVEQRGRVGEQRRQACVAVVVDVVGKGQLEIELGCRDR